MTRFTITHPLQVKYFGASWLTFNSVQFSSPNILNAPWLLIEMFTYKDTKGKERHLVIYIAKSCCWGWDYTCPKEKSCHITNEWEVKFAKLAINLPIYIQNKNKLDVNVRHKFHCQPAVLFVFVMHCIGL